MEEENQGLLSQGTYLMASKEVSGDFSLDDVENEITRSSGDFTEDDVQVGDVVYTDSEVNPGPFTVTSVSATTLGVEETVETDAEGATELTVFIRVRGATNFEGLAGEASEIDMTDLESDAMEFAQGLEDFGELTADMNFMPEDRGQALLSEMKSNGETREFILTRPSVNGKVGYRWEFQGYVQSLGMSAAVNDKMARSLSIRVNGKPTEEVIAVS